MALGELSQNLLVVGGNPVLLVVPSPVPEAELEPRAGKAGEKSGGCLLGLAWLMEHGA